MKKITSILAVLFVFAGMLSSCKKDSSVTAGITADAAKQKKLNYAYGEPPPGGGTQGQGVPIYEDASGNYYTNYGDVGSISFGSMFPYPTSVPSGYNGSIYTIGSLYGFAYNGSNLLSFSQTGGNKFIALFGTYVSAKPSNLDNAFNDYYSDVNLYLSGGISLTTGNPVTNMPDLQTYVEKYGIGVSAGTTSGIIVIKGQFVYDSTSPTNISIVSWDFTPATPNPPVY